MISKTKQRLVLSVVLAGLLSIVCVSSQAARSVRSDSSDTAFEFAGGFWGTNNRPDDMPFRGPGLDAGTTDFKLRISPAQTPHFFTVCMSEEGFIKFIGMSATCTNTDYALLPTGGYIAVFATDLDSISSFAGLKYTRGFVDSKAPYKLGEANPAMRFWWNGVSLEGDGDHNSFDVQVVLIDRSNGTNNGDFDIELNYGTGGDQVPPAIVQNNTNADGKQRFKLGPNAKGPTSGPFLSDGTPIRYCFRGGSVQVTCN